MNKYVPYLIQIFKKRQPGNKLCLSSFDFGNLVWDIFSTMWNSRKVSKKGTEGSWRVSKSSVSEWLWVWLLLAILSLDYVNSASLIKWRRAGVYKKRRLFKRTNESHEVSEQWDEKRLRSYNGPCLLKLQSHNRWSPIVGDEKKLETFFVAAVTISLTLSQTSCHPLRRAHKHVGGPSHFPHGL